MYYVNIDISNRIYYCVFKHFLVQFESQCVTINNLSINQFKDIKSVIEVYKRTMNRIH